MLHTGHTQRWAAQTPPLSRACSVCTCQTSGQDAPSPGRRNQKSPEGPGHSCGFFGTFPRGCHIACSRCTASWLWGGPDLPDLIQPCILPLGGTADRAGLPGAWPWENSSSCGRSPRAAHLQLSAEGHKLPTSESTFLYAVLYLRVSKRVPFSLIGLKMVLLW